MKTTVRPSLTQACPTSVPTNVGPPPISPRRPRNDQLGRTPSCGIGPTMPNPSVALWSPKPTISARASEISPAAPACPIARPSPKLWSPIPVAISSASRCPAPSAREPGALGVLGDRRGARPDHVRRRPVPHPAVVVDEAHQADDQSAGQQRGEADELAPRAAVRHRLLERLLDRADAVGEDVVEQEHEDPRGEAAQRRPQPGVGALDAAQREPQEDCEACDCAEDEDLGRAHEQVVLSAVVRNTLQRRRDYSPPPAPPQTGTALTAQRHSVDEYLETIYFLAFPIGEYAPPGTRNPTLAARVAEMLGVSRASAGEMLKRLERDGLVRRGEHKEAILTRKGRARAEKVVRKHRIIERLLTDFMGYTAAEAHVHADELGDTFSDEMIERVAERLGHPDRCPHGWPVDPDFEQAENEELKALAELEAGDRATIVRLAEHDGDLLHWFYDQGFEPGRKLQMKAADPAAGGFRVKLGNREETVAEKAAAGLFVRPS